MTQTGTSNPLDPDTEFRRLQVENHQQAERIAELENALSEMYTFFQPRAWMQLPPTSAEGVEP